ncbi:MAG: DUF3305 domain-containing protein [Alphaproteobacteria bacterium]|nr:DUF3305 domain-containing protein [Alphaproteobacteria bacterium]
MPQEHVSIDVGVVIERRAVDHPWIDHRWTPIAVVPGAPPVAGQLEQDWPVLDQGEGWTHFHAATLKLEMFGKETEGYRINLSKDPPSVFVVLRRGEEADEAEVFPFAVTVCPFEAQQFLDAGDDLVEAVPMPEPIHAWVKDFADRNHVDEPFKKRKRRPFDPRKEGFAGEGPPPVQRPRAKRL